MKWFFRPKALSEKVRNPIQGEFFATEAIKNPSDALVRESIQNALDASADETGGKGEPIHVRYFLSTDTDAVAPREFSSWFDGVWPHLQAPDNGIREVPESDKPCPFLVCEDFGTRGLEGDPQQSEPLPNVDNDFFYFFRAEGLSGKSGDDRGRWGVGKHVFARSGRGNLSFGLSVRSSDKSSVLMGQAVLKSHRCDTTYYCPDGYFGKPSGEGFTLPVTEDVSIETFKKTFSLSRKRQPGLSVVVPWVDDEITIDDLTEAVVRGYFFPILKGELTVAVATPHQSLSIDKNSLDEAALCTKGGEGTDLLNLVDLAIWASRVTAVDRVELLPCSDRPVWNDDLVPKDQIESVRRGLREGKKIAVRAPLTVRQKGVAPKNSHFDFFIWRDGFESGRPTFVREGLIISDVKGATVRGVRSFVVIERGALAGLLGDAENPAHTEWQSKSENFRGKYTYGASYIKYVSDCVSNFVHAITAQDDEIDKTLLADVFFVPGEQGETEGAVGPTQKKPKKVPPIDPPPQERKKRFNLKKGQGGFLVTRGDKDAVPPARLEVSVAYDVRKGKALRKYDPADFRLDKEPVRIDKLKNLEIRTRENNRMVIDITNPDFALSVQGFDERRDLFVSVRIVEESHD